MPVNTSSPIDTIDVLDIDLSSSVVAVCGSVCKADLVCWICAFRLSERDWTRLEASCQCEESNVGLEIPVHLPAECTTLEELSSIRAMIGIVTTDDID